MDKEKKVTKSNAVADFNVLIARQDNLTSTLQNELELDDVQLDLFLMQHDIQKMSLHDINHPQSPDNMSRIGSPSRPTHNSPPKLELSNKLT